LGTVPDDGRWTLGKRVAVITGAASGIGRATCLALGEAGARVVAVGRRFEALAAIVAEVEGCGGEAAGLGLDVRVERDMEEMAQWTLARYGRIDILVASAGVLRAGSPRVVAEMSVAEWDLVVETNLRGVFLSNRAVLPAMLKQRQGAIINLSSTSGRQGLAYDSAYCASKFGVIGFSEALAEEVRTHGVKVQVVLPGPVDTTMWEQNAPLPRPAQILPPERVADLILYLLTLPEDTMLIQPTIVGFRGRRVGRAPDVHESAETPSASGLIREK
jgi:NAD(P)-dependent dehydrogenase (short-subunit alcohol dehydrogenase family)